MNIGDNLAQQWLNDFAASMERAAERHQFRPHCRDCGSVITGEAFNHMCASCAQKAAREEMIEHQHAERGEL